MKFARLVLVTAVMAVHAAATEDFSDFESDERLLTSNETDANETASDFESDPAPSPPAPPPAPTPVATAPAPGPAAPGPAPAPGPASPTTTAEPDNSTDNSTTVPISSPVVEVEMSMTVDDAQGFVDNAEINAPIMATAVAAMVSVEVEDVSVELRVGAERRRLVGLKLRRLSEAVIVDATIMVEDEAAGDALGAVLDEVTPEMMTNHTNDAFEAADVAIPAGLNVTGATFTVVVPVIIPDSSPRDGIAGGAVSSRKASSFAPFIAVSAWLLSRV